MPREFFVYSDDTGACILKVDEERQTHHFQDILEAITHARTLKGPETATLSVYDAIGQLVFTQNL